MKTFFFTCLICLTYLGFSQTPTSKVAVLPKFIVKNYPENAEGTPSATVSVVFGKTTAKLAKITGNAENIGKSEYPSKGIPAKAIAACGAWWAGAGDYFYIIQKGDSYLVFQGWQSEEQTEKGFHWKQVKVLKP